VVITHRTNLLQEVDKILVLKEGLATAFGPRDQVLASLMGNPVPKQLAAN
jgi:ABC-type protease/lipase transport system fused ATPase/permease subunit